ncbi:MAG: hypothetical protein E2O50_06530 [Gammaproteobacteria bacterium]|nr:MAG: hypothetical protein E2O50_06530 [Gammaproteobacteria bacterium]
MLTAFATVTVAQNNDAEIEYLLTSVGSSNCVFIRNGTQHPAANAESHLRMKYEKNRRYIDNADEFIYKLASKSSWTGKPYTLACPGAEVQATKSWLLERLAEYRAAN